MTVPDELLILKEQPIHKNAVVKLMYSPLGTKLAAISQDNIISVMKAPFFQNQLNLTMLGGHNSLVNSIHFSVNVQYLYIVLGTSCTFRSHSHLWASCSLKNPKTEGHCMLNYYPIETYVTRRALWMPHLTGKHLQRGSALATLVAFKQLLWSPY